jgi:OOP family OmpA-OmpF porin
MKKIYLIQILLLLFTISLFSQTKKPLYNHPFSGALGISAEGGITISRTDYLNSDPGYMVKGSFEYFFPSTTRSAFGLKFMGGLGTIAGNNDGRPISTNANSFVTKLYMFGGGVEYTFNLGSVNPYVLGGGYYVSFNPLDKAGNKLPRNAVAAYKTNEPNYTGEIGIKYSLSKYFSLDMAGATYISSNDNLDDIVAGKANDIYFSITAGITFFVQPIRDSDHDGVEDSEDMCPDTPPGVKVDVFGCPIDSDHDGVPDYLDKCPDTPVGVAVDSTGCPIDSDHDGVPDYLDMCPNTPRIAKVDVSGCPIDSDHDGVPDYEDNCPDTPPGTKVDSLGCPVVSQTMVSSSPVNKVILNANTNFEFRSTKLTSNAEKILSKLADLMKDNPQTKWKITGYTDNIGNKQLNKKVSLERASSVFIYFLSNGLNKDRFEVFGAGEENPIGNNKLEFGRTLNRRVEIVNQNYVEPAKPERTVTPFDTNAYNSQEDHIADNTIFTDGNIFAIQVSSWKTERKADKEVKRYKAKGFNAFIFKYKSPDKNETRYRVRIGYFHTLEDAENYIEEKFGP